MTVLVKPRRLLAVAALFALASCGGNPARTTAGPDTLAFAGPPKTAAATDSWAPWPQAEHDARRSAASTATGPQTAATTNDRWEYGVSPAGKRSWQHDRESWNYSLPGITNDGIAYFSHHTGQLDAVHARTVALVAKYTGGARHATGEPGIEVGGWTAPLVDARHNVYRGTESGHAHGVDAAGRSLFDLALGSTVGSYPALGSDGLLVFGVADGRLLGIGSPHA